MACTVPSRRWKAERYERSSWARRFRASASRDNALAHRIKNEFQNAVNIEFLQDMGAMRLHRGQADVQQVSNFLVGAPLGDDLQNLALACAWRVVLETRRLGAISINVRITAVRKLAVEAADNGLLAPELASGIVRVKGVASKGVRLGNWLTVRQAQTLLDAPDATTIKGLRDRAILAVLLGGR
jgi:site-specific recombinase XerD